MIKTTRVVYSPFSWGIFGGVFKTVRFRDTDPWGNIDIETKYIIARFEW